MTGLIAVGIIVAVGAVGQRTSGVMQVAGDTLMEAAAGPPAAVGGSTGTGSGSTGTGSGDDGGSGGSSGPPQPTTYTSCNPLVQGRYSNTTAPYIFISASAATAAAARTACETTQPAAGYRTVRCSWRQSEGIARIVTVSGSGHSEEWVGYTEGALPASNFWTAACTPTP